MALRGIRVVEMAGLAPAPFCGMILSDFGANVVRVDKPNSVDQDVLCRGKRSITVDLKKKSGVGVVKRLCEKSDVLLEPFRPGVMEKLGLGPDVLCKANPKLVYARLTGFGQSGPYAQRAGHDINYLAISGVLSRLGGSADRPTPPINLLADFAAGGLNCAFGVLLALFERNKSGQGQVVDANMVQGAAYISSFVFNMRNGLFGQEAGKNLLDGGSYFYDTYKTKDGKFMSVGAIEPQFYRKFVHGLGLTLEDLPQDMAGNADFRAKIASIFLQKTQSEWCSIYDDVDACVAPVLDFEEAIKHPHNAHTFLMSDNGESAVRAAPSLSRTPASETSSKRPIMGEHSGEVLREFEFNENEVKELLKDGTINQSKL